jgi:predicted transcriptional regulator of viral defense system
MQAAELRKIVDREEIDYQLLLTALKDYSRPRDKISSLLKSGDLIRVKKGLYTFGRNIATRAYSKELFANLIYGPSAISLRYALAFYGLIPERVETITSVTNNRIKHFDTPIGHFDYRYLNQKKYPVGLTLDDTNKKQAFLIASPEKALVDQMHLIDKDIVISNENELEAYLLADLRLDEALLKKFKLKTLKELQHAYQDSRLALLLSYVQKRK